MNLSFRLFKYFSQKNHSKILLSLEGNIGAGKTTFLRLLNDDLKIPFEIVPEPVNDWQQFGKENNKVNLLDLFYKDPKKYGYIFQSFCFYSRLKNWSQNVNSFKKNLLIFERSVYSDKYKFFKKI